MVEGGEGRDGLGPDGGGMTRASWGPGEGAAPQQPQVAVKGRVGAIVEMGEFDTADGVRPDPLVCQKFGSLRLALSVLGWQAFPSLSQ